MKDFTMKISGSITIGDGDIIIHNKVKEAIENGCGIIVLDLGGVNYMDSSAVGEIVACYTSAKNKGVDFALTAMQPKIIKLMKTMCFLDLIQVFDSTEDALQILRTRAKKRASS